MNKNKEEEFLLEVQRTLQRFKDKFVKENISKNFYIYKQMDLLQDCIDILIAQLPRAETKEIKNER